MKELGRIKRFPIEFFARGIVVEQEVICTLFIDEDAAKKTVVFSLKLEREQIKEFVTFEKAIEIWPGIEYDQVRLYVLYRPDIQAYMFRLDAGRDRSVYAMVGQELSLLPPYRQPALP